MPSKERFPVEQSPIPVPTSRSLLMILSLFLLILIVTVGLYVTDIALLPSLALLSALFIGSFRFALRFQRSSRQKEIFTRSTPASPRPTIQQRQVTAPHEPSIQPPLPTAPERRLADFYTFDLAASQPIDFNLRTTVEETVSRFTTIAKERKIELSCLFSADSPTPFRGDPGDIRLILINLIDYAMSTITHGEITIRGMLVQQTSTHATFRFSVSTLNSTTLPAGVSPQELPTTENRGYSSPYDQHADGIAISKQLVKTFGGQLEVERTPDVGTTIWFTLMLEKQPSKVFSDSPPRTSLSGVRLLLVSSDFSLSDEDTFIWGLTSRSVFRYPQAWSILTTAVQENQAYDIVLIHCQELEADALELAARVRATEALATLRLVFISTSGKKGDARQIRQAGFDAYLTYPVSSPLLFECLTSVLGQPPQPLAPDLPLVTRYTLAEARTRGRARILIVDSNLPDQKHAVHLVEELGYRADVAITAREAIEANARLPYAAVLLPTQMPGIDGIAAAIQIRQHDQQEGVYTPLIGVLQSQSDDGRAQCLAAGMDAVVSKPLLSESLKITIDGCSLSKGGQQLSLAISPTKNKEAMEVNLHEALARIEGDTELFDEMTVLFFEEYPKALRQMHEAITRQDGQALAYSANALKGALGNFAAIAAIDTTSRLELTGRHGDLSLAPLLLTDLEEQLTRLRAQLTDFRLHAAA